VPRKRLRTRFPRLSQIALWFDLVFIGGTEHFGAAYRFSDIMFLSMSTNWLQTLKDTSAVWKYDPKQMGSHAILTTGVHSDGYINMARITERPDILSEMIAHLIDKARANGVLSNTCSPQWIVGPALGSVAIAYEAARQLDCKAGFTEKYESTMQLRRFFIPTNEPVLVVDDAMSSGSSILKTLTCLHEKNLNALPFVLVLANYSGGASLEVVGKSYQIISLVEFDFEAHRWEPDECPLCKSGSPAFRPKEKWSEFQNLH